MNIPDSVVNEIRLLLGEVVEGPDCVEVVESGLASVIATVVSPKFEEMSEAARQDLVWGAIWLRGTPAVQAAVEYVNTLTPQEDEALATG